MKGDEFVRHGTVTQWYERPSSNSQGKKRGVSPWFAGKRHGQLVEWYDNGKLSLRQSDVHGKIHGICERWYDDGQKQMEVTYSEGNMNGVLRRWYPNGQLSREEPVVDGNAHGQLKTWYENGKQQIEGDLDTGERHGTWTIWWRETGVPKYTLRFSKGRLQPCSKEQFVVALGLVSGQSKNCFPERETFLVAGLNASVFLSVFGPPSRKLPFGNDTYDQTWVYACTDGELEMDACHPHPLTPIALRRFIGGRLW